MKEGLYIISNVRGHMVSWRSAASALVGALMLISLSGCAGGRGGIRHNYSSEYGNGTVYYEGGHYGSGDRHHKPKPQKKHKAPKKHKDKKHDKDRHGKGKNHHRHHDDD